MSTTLTFRNPRLPAKPARANATPEPDHILQTGFSFWPAKALLSAVELGVFTELGNGPLDAERIRQRLQLDIRGVRDFLDALVALNFLERRHGKYSNTVETSYYLDRNKPTYMGGLLEMSNARLYNYWGSLTEALRTGKPQNESKNGGDLFGSLYQTPQKLEAFLRSMTGISLGAATAIGRKFPWAEYRGFVDVGSAQGAVPVQLAKMHPHLEGIGYDLPGVQPVFEKYVAANGVGERVRFQAGDFFKEPLPECDVIIMGHILHDWNLQQKRLLIQKAYDALPKGGAFIVYEALIDDERRENAFGLLMSLNMLIETHGGFDYSGADCRAWMHDAGFRQTRVEHLAVPDSMVVGIK